MRGARLAALALEGSAWGAVRAWREPERERREDAYPIILMHGFAGFRELGIGSVPLLEYFNGVPAVLRRMGYRVFAPEVSPFDPPQVRAAEWLHEIDAIRRRTGARKVHLIGHSQGGLDARVLVAPPAPAEDTPIGPLMGLGYGPHVASIVTIGTPHLGSALADRFQLRDPVGQEVLDRVLDLVGVATQIFRGDPQAVATAVVALSRRHALEHFNRIIKDDPSVPCYAIAGDPGAGDLVSPLLRLGYEHLCALESDTGGGPNDGLVTVESALFGNAIPGAESRPGGEPGCRSSHWRSLGIIRADHVVQVGIPLTFFGAAEFDHLAFFIDLVSFLNRGDSTYTLY